MQYRDSYYKINHLIFELLLITHNLRLPTYVILYLYYKNTTIIESV